LPDRNIVAGGSPVSAPAGKIDTGLRVLMTVDGASGIWQYSLDLARGLAPLGHESVLALTGRLPTEAQRAQAGQIPGLRLVETGLVLDGLDADDAELRDASQALADLASSIEADIVQLNSPALAGLAAFPAPVVAVHHRCAATWWEAVYATDLPRDLAGRAAHTGAGLHAADLVVTPTAAFGDCVQRRYGLRTTPRCVHYGRTPLRIDAFTYRDFVFTAGSLWDEGRNLGTLDAAAARVEVPIRAAGAACGPNGSQVMFDHIHCLGALDEGERAGWLSARPVFVSTALYEPFAPMVLEAASAGCPLILSDIPCFRELWEDVAIFVAPRDEAGFTRAIAALVADDFERAVLGRAARERARRYNPDAMAAQMASAYRSLLPTVLRPVLAARQAA
jgi:hypothetical protein